MLRAMMEAEVGDHVLGDDPTANELERLCAERMGMDWAYFLPSGTMANQVAVLIHTRPGTEVMIDEGAHLVNLEDGGAAAWSGVQFRFVPSVGGIPDPIAYEAAFRGPSRFAPQATLLCIENTHNAAGGTVVPVERVAEMAALAAERGIPVHLDGARLPNAAVAAGRDMRDWTAHADTVMLSLSKGLGAPIGSVLAGPARLEEAAWRARRRLGGGMRQAGLLAAAGIHGLLHNFSRLAEDHERAKRLADGLRRIGSFRVSYPETNIVMIEIEGSSDTAEGVIGQLAGRGVMVSQFGPRRRRAVTHLDIDDAAVDSAITAFEEVALTPEIIA
jgi:threonine aldolase